MRIIFVVMAFLLGFLEGTECLKDKLKKGEKGDYVVLEQHKNLNVLFVREREGKWALIEEIVVPTRMKEGPCREWIEKGGKGNTSWVLLKVDLEEGRVGKMYSYSTGCYYDTSTEGGAFFLTTLLNIPLYEVPFEKRKRVGYAPKKGERDVRKLWEPPFLCEGKRVEGASLKEYKAVWPKDKSPLEGKEIEVYFAEGSAEMGFFPVYLEVKGILHKGKLRLVDSGKNLKSPFALPPQF